MSRNYNHKMYKVVQKTNSVIRDKVAPNPGAELNVFGFFGKLLGWLLNYLIAKPVHFLVFAIVGLFYRKGKDSPFKGVILYTLFFILAMGALTMAIRLMLLLR